MPTYKEFEGINLITDPTKNNIDKVLLKISTVLILCFVVLCEDSLASSAHQYSKKECLELTDKDATYDNSAKRILKLKTVTEFNALLKKDKLEKVSLMLFSGEPKYINNKCFWYIRLEENHKTHLVFWKSFLVDIDGSDIYEENAEPDSYSIAK